MSAERPERCALCGLEYESAPREGCAGCPLSTGCQTRCCPRCGTKTPATEGSVLVRWLDRLLGAPRSGAATPGRRTP